MKVRAAILTLALPVVLAAQAGKITQQGRDFIEEINGTLAAAPHLQVTTPGGQVELHGGAGGDITYRAVKRVHARTEEEARRKFATATLVARRSGDTAQLILEQSGRHSDVGADFFVTAPRSLAQAHLETAGGGVVAEGIDGEVIAETAGGNMRADQIGGGKLETAGGNIDLGLIRGRFSAESAGGNITLRDGRGESTLSTAAGTVSVENNEKNLRVETAGGDVRIRRCGGDVRVETAGGGIHLGEIAGMVTAESAGGTIDVESARSVSRAESAAGAIRLNHIGGAVRAETAAGNVFATVIANRASWADSVLETAAGDVVVYLPSDLAVTIRAIVDMATSQQAIRSFCPMTFRGNNGSHGPQEVVGECKMNGGGAQLKIRTASGTIEIRRVSSTK